MQTICTTFRCAAFFFISKTNTMVFSWGGREYPHICFEYKMASVEILLSWSLVYNFNTFFLKRLKSFCPKYPKLLKLRQEASVCWSVRIHFFLLICLFSGIVLGGVGGGEDLENSGLKEWKRSNSDCFDFFVIFWLIKDVFNWFSYFSIFVF